MAPTRTIKNKHAAGVSKHASSKSGIANSKAASSRSSHNIANVSESGVKKLGRSKGANVKQTKLAADAAAKRKKAREGKGKKTQFTEKELRDMGVPELNGIRPVGVTAPRGKKKGKVFVDDRESMATILALVHAEKDGQIESKMQRARQLEEIREARKVEAEKRKESKKEKLDEKKEELRKKRRRSGGDAEAVEKEEKKADGAEPKKKKRVSFA